MTSLWDAGAILETVRKMVAVEHRDPIEEFAQYPGCGEAREAPPDNNRVGLSHRRRSITRAGLCGAESEVNEIAAEENFRPSKASPQRARIHTVTRRIVADSPLLQAGRASNNAAMALRRIQIQKASAAQWAYTLRYYFTSQLK